MKEKALIVKFWDGTEKQAKNREEAIQIAKEGLEGWRQGKDYIVWAFSHPSKKLPDTAIVVTEYGEETDACAVITLLREETHEGEIWRKPGPIGWCKIVGNQTPEAPNYDGGLSGFSVQYGNFSRKTKRIYWRRLTLFVAVKSYAEFVREMKEDYYYLMKGVVKNQLWG